MIRNCSRVSQQTRRHSPPILLPISRWYTRRVCRVTHRRPVQIVINPRQETRRRIGGPSSRVRPCRDTLGRWMGNIITCLLDRENPASTLSPGGRISSGGCITVIIWLSSLISWWESIMRILNNLYYYYYFVLLWQTIEYSGTSISMCIYWNIELEELYD